MHLVRYEKLFVDNLIPRDIEVWLPQDYSTDQDTQYSVLYMHDGQNLFEPEKSYSGVTWGVAEAVTRLVEAGKIEPTIIVGIANTENRFGDYLPLKPFQTPKGQGFLRMTKWHPQLKKFQYVADQYLRLIVEHIKPMIDDTYRTKSDPAHTTVMGSSMGGLISLYAVCDYPEVFGRAGCVSTHWPLMKKVIKPYLAEKLPPPKTHKIYFSHGTVGLDKKYPRHQQKIDKIMREKGFTEGENWITKVFEGDTHNEACWKSRIEVPLTLLLGN